MRLPQGAGDFSLPRIVQADTGAYPAIYTTGFEEVKRPEHEAGHLHLVARLRMFGGRGVYDVHAALSGGSQIYRTPKFIVGSLGLYSVRL